MKQNKSLNRLDAIIKTGIAGSSRGVHDVLKLSGDADTSPRYVAVARNMMSGRDSSLRTSRETVAELKAFINTHRRAINFVHAIYSSRQKGLGQAGILAALACASYYVPHVKLQRFARVLQTGIPESPDENVIINLRNWIMGKIAEPKLGSGFGDAAYVMTERAIVAHAENETHSTVDTPMEGPFPLPTDGRFEERFQLQAISNEVSEKNH